MRYLIISDIHSNLEALEAVVADAAGAYDEVICCGDVVGYGADPDAAADWVRRHARITVRGNHDKAVAGAADLEWFNEAAQAATLWTRENLSRTNLDWLASLPEGPLEIDGFEIAHGSPLDEDEYIITPAHARRLFPHVGWLTFIGHTHIQGGFRLHRNGVEPIEPLWEWESRKEVPLPEDFGNLINPGSVGQPRDHDSRAAYAVYDTEKKIVELRRVPYDIDTAARKILEAGLPEPLAYRLRLGR